MLQLCCGREPKIYESKVKGLSGKKYFVRCSNCKSRTRSRVFKRHASSEWNLFKNELFKKQLYDVCDF